ncbi:MAG: 30S ribosome-binding factor RbfA [Planctomycetes bacterium]|nr:30S ribosome-binding factor RbfA [Planctomycetota bacterium]MBI3835888.1 30S ribosome-binding factor RbfA [Planctomycetota bacterium]
MRPYRKERVASLIQEIVSEAITRKLSDPRIAPLTTVSRVEMSPDLTIANVFFTVLGEGTAEAETLSALRHASGFVQRIVARELTMRQCPELRFSVDDVAKKVKATMRLLDENRRLIEEREAKNSPVEESDSRNGSEALSEEGEPRASVDAGSESQDDGGAE